MQSQHAKPTGDDCSAAAFACFRPNQAASSPTQIRLNTTARCTQCSAAAHGRMHPRNLVCRHVGTPHAPVWAETAMFRAREAADARRRPRRKPPALPPPAPGCGIAVTHRKIPAQLPAQIPAQRTRPPIQQHRCCRPLRVCSRVPELSSGSRRRGRGTTASGAG